MNELDERFERYLDGGLSTEETRELERALVAPEVATEFARAVLLRELLRTAGPGAPPPELLLSLEGIGAPPGAWASAGPAPPCGA